MSPKTSFTLDTSDFDAGMEKLVKKALPGAIAKGLGRAGLQLLTDAINEVPGVPLDEGTLQGSGSVHVEDRRVHTSAEAGGGGKGTPADGVTTGGLVDLLRNLATAIVGFNTPYAARLHEHPEYMFSQKKPGAGGKYLQTPLVQRRKDYTRIIARAIKERLGT